MTPFMEILIGWALIALCAMGAVLGTHLIEDGNARRQKLNVTNLKPPIGNSSFNNTAKINVVKLKINRAFDDFDIEFRNISENFPKNSDKNAAKFNSHGVLNSGEFIQSQMDLSIATKRQSDKAYEILKRNIENILVDSFEKTSLESVSPEFNEEKTRLNNAKEKCKSFYVVLNNNPKSWEVRSLNQSNLTKNFDVTKY